MGPEPAFGYVTYVETTPAKLWECLTGQEATAAYWGHRNVSDWRPGSPWEHRRTDGSGVADVVGTVVESAPPRRLVVTWAAPGEDREDRPQGPSRVTFDLAPHGDTVRLTLRHEGFRDVAEQRQAAEGWQMVLSSLKTYAETGRPLPGPLWSVGEGQD